MENTHKNQYHQAVVNFVSGTCPPGEREGEFYDPEVPDLEAHCENCDVPKCFGSWLESRGN